MASSIAEVTGNGTDWHRLDVGKLRELLAVSTETAEWFARAGGTAVE